MSDAEVPWRYEVSSTLRSIYVLRYGLFAGGLAVLAATVDRQALHHEPPLAGLLLGLAVGLFAFRGQLRPLRFPRLVLSRDALYLIQRKRAVVLPWSAIAEITQQGDQVALRLLEPLQSPDGSPAEAIVLEAKKLGTPAPHLSATLDRLLKDPTYRRRLPEDRNVRATYAVLSSSG